MEIALMEEVIVFIIKLHETTKKINISIYLSATSTTTELLTIPHQEFMWGPIKHLWCNFLHK